MRIAMLSVHSSPLAALGGKEAGGMNVYVRELSRELGRRGIGVDIFTRSQDLSCWIESHVRALEFFGGAPEVVIPDNTKTAVKHPCRYEPELNPTYRELAEHYGFAVVPARPLQTSR